MPRELSRSALIERSIIKTYHKQLWTPFINALKQYALISPGDKIAVCISGGKDSMLLAKLMQQLHHHSDVPFALEYLVMDPGYAPANRAKIEENAEILGVPVTIFASDIFAVANGAEKNPCYLCARMRRGALYAKAQELGCNKIALGHHRDDVIETTVMAMLYGAQLQGMMPKLHSTNFPGMELIRPLYCVREEDIIAWAKHNELSFLQCACRFTERTATAGHETESKRKEVKALIRTLRETNPDLESNIFHAIHAVNLDMFPGWKTKGEKHSFLETY